MSDSTLTHFELRFQSLFDGGRGYSFPCDPVGHVDLNELSERARNNYFYARAVVSRELAYPAVRPSEWLVPAGTQPASVLNAIISPVRATAVAGGL